MRKVLLLEEAVLEGEEAAGWYDAQREGLGREFRDAFSRTGSAVVLLYPFL